MAHRISPEAEADLDEIWLHAAKESSSIAIADRLVDAITERFWILARYPHVGRRRDKDLRSGLRSFPIWNYIIIYSVEGQDVRILRVIHGSRDLKAQLGH